MNAEHSGANQSANPHFSLVIVALVALFGAALVAARDNHAEAPSPGASTHPVADNPDSDPRRCPSRAHGAHLCN